MAHARKNRDERRQEIIDAARALIIEEGAAALSLRAVARRIGIKLASLQYHVGGRDELIDLILDDAVSRYTEVLKSYRDNDRDPPLEVFRKAVAWLVTQDAGWEAQTSFEIQLWSFAEIDARARSALNGYFDIYTNFLFGLVVKARPDLSRSAQRDRARAVASLIEGSTLFFRGTKTRGDTNRFRNAVIDAAEAILSRTD